jgi:hypothetical protein
MLFVVKAIRNYLGYFLDTPVWSTMLTLLSQRSEATAHFHRAEVKEQLSGSPCWPSEEHFQKAVATPTAQASRMAEAIYD